jgi:hypothetical protein
VTFRVMTPCSLVLRSAFCLNFRNVPSIFWLLWHSRAIEQCKCCSVLFCSVPRTTLALWQSRAIEQFKCCSVLFCSVLSPEQHLLCGRAVLLNSTSVVLFCSVLSPEQHLLCGRAVLLNSSSVVLFCSQNNTCFVAQPCYLRVQVLFCSVPRTTLALWHSRAI